MVEPLACVLRGAERLPRGRVLIVGHGFIGRLFSAALTWREDEVFAVDSDPRRAGREPDGPVDAAVLCAPGGIDAALQALEPGGMLLVFADGEPMPPSRVYRNELTVVRLALGDTAPHGDGGGAPPRARAARADGAPARPLRRGPRPLPQRRGAEGRLHPVKALIFHGPGDLRLEDVPDPQPGPGDVLVEVEVALTDGTDAKAFQRGHPLLLGPPPSPFGHEFCGIDVALGRRVVAANSAPCGVCAACARGDETLCENLLPLLNGAYAELILVPERIARAEPPPRPAGPRARGRRADRAARVLPARRRPRRDRAGRRGRDPRRRARSG